MSVSKSLFGSVDGSEVHLYTIKNSKGASVCIQTLGAGIQAVCVPDRNGELGDVVLGFDEPKYYADPDLGYQGLVVGRVANRIRGAKFVLDGKEYNTPNNQGSWTLHGGGRFSFSVWEEESVGENSVTLKRFSPDGEDGFPGNFTMRVTYTFTDDCTLRVEYSVLSDRKTVAAPTNHAYFNLSGRTDGTIENHILKINADRYTETDGDQLPTGRLLPLAGTMMDFSEAHAIGEHIDEPFSAIIDGIGYDNNYCLKKAPRDFTEAAVLRDPKSGRELAVFTDLPGIQLYCGGWLAKSGNPGKSSNGAVTYRRGVALETQFYPDSVNHADEFPFEYVEANKEFTTVTEFRFSAK